MSRALPTTHNAFVYVIERSAQIGGARTTVTAGQLAVLGAGDLLALRSDGGGGCSALQAARSASRSLAGG